MKKFQALMKSKFENAKKDNKGFSLVELIIAVVILGIIAVVAIGGLYGNVTKSRINTDVSNARDIQSALSTLSADKDLYKWAQNSGSSTDTIKWTTGADVSGGDTTVGSTTIKAKVEAILSDGFPASKTNGEFRLVFEPKGDGNVKITCKIYKSSAANAEEVTPAE